ncbi:MAG: sulfotransferase domain-containing protein [Bacteroidales bacterium]|nr:sulfotransferase domain-containing protein [Bacteroidales bacterium]MCM1414521.1 sulfotransferase domain-containing protein [bacterium]MCM1422572.1 sulfotransferase domain-containing protein [bacterium]
MNEREIISKNIQQYFMKNDNKKIVILPIRNLSGMVRDILSEKYNIQEQFLVDNYAYDMKHIYPIDRMPDGYKECTYMLAAFGSTKKALREKLSEYVPEDHIVDLLFDEERERIFASEQKVHIDFLCPGFAKCGTTSLHHALAQNPKIFLPQVKETQFLRYSVNEMAHESFKSYYKVEDTAGKLVGDIEPSYICNAEDVYRYFGKDLKLIFCVRNPVNTLYSNFKIAMRRETVMMESSPIKSEVVEEFEQVTPEMFDRWAVKCRYKEQYANRIRTFMEYYPIEQIKIIVVEELYADVYGVMEDLQDFLGISKENRLEYKEFPRENVGNKVSKDRASYEINMSLKQLYNRLLQKGDTQSLALLLDLREKVEEFTMIDYNEPMLESTRRNLLDYYMDSIHDLEGMIGRSLEGVWY